MISQLMIPPHSSRGSTPVEQAQASSLSDGKLAEIPNASRTHASAPANLGCRLFRNVCTAAVLSDVTHKRAEQFRLLANPSDSGMSSPPLIACNAASTAVFPRAAIEAAMASACAANSCGGTTRLTRPIRAPPPRTGFRPSESFPPLWKPRRLAATVECRQNQE